MTAAKDFKDFFQEADITMLDDEKVVGFSNLDASEYSVPLVRIHFHWESDKEFYYVAGSGNTMLDGQAQFVLYSQAEYAESGIHQYIMVPEFYKKIKF